MFELKHSVWVNGDPDFTKLQAITRVNTFNLLLKVIIKNKFLELAKCLTYANNWNNNWICQNIMSIFSKVCPAKDAFKKYHQSIKIQLVNKQTLFRILIFWDN